MPKVTYPMKYVQKEGGTLVWKIHTETPTEESFLLSSGNRKIHYKTNQFQLISGSKTLSITKNLIAGYTTILWSWNKSKEILVVQDAVGTMITSSASWPMLEPGVIQLAGTPLFKGHLVFLESYQEPVVDTPSQTFLDASSLYLSDISSGKIVESRPAIRNHAFSDLLLTKKPLLQKDFRGDISERKEQLLMELTMTPRDASPILVSDSQGPFRRSYFFDSTTGIYTTVNEEEFIYRKEDYLVLSYNGFNPERAITVLCEGETVTLSPVIVGEKVYLALSEEEKEYFYGKILTVRYELDRSYVIERNEDSAYDSHKLMFSNHQNRAIEVVQEGNRFSNQRLTKEIELNPLVNPRHTGFLYISDAEQRTQAFRLNVSSAYLTADGIDSADILVEAIDEEGNEVLSPYIDVFVQLPDGAASSEAGTIIPIVNRDTLKARVTNGRCYFKYLAPVLTRKESAENQKVYIMVYDRKAKIGTQLSVILRPTGSDKRTVSANYHSTEAAPAASVPFEYFARFYECLLPENHPLSSVDKDGDQVLTRSDWLLFEELTTNQTRMQQLSETLLESEAF